MGEGDVGTILRALGTLEESVRNLTERVDGVVDWIAGEKLRQQTAAIAAARIRGRTDFLRLIQWVGDSTILRLVLAAGAGGYLGRML